ncbi:hypothetical protein G6F43_007739 [Rhizopus delemar]|nr:hypothetical protein G6F43_007739 [Rhizopus delemar]
MVPKHFDQEKKKSKKSSKRDVDSGEPVHSTKPKRSHHKEKHVPEDKNEMKVPINEVKNQATERKEDEKDIKTPLEEVKDQAVEKKEDAKDVIDETKDRVKESTESDSESLQDADALTTMNAIMEYNRKLMQRIAELEGQNDSDKDPKEAVKDTVQDITEEVKDKQEKASKKGGSTHTFEFPLGDMMKSYGSLATSELPEETPEKEEKKNEDDNSSVNNDDSESNNLRIGDGDKDDIVVKVDATRKGITLTIHIPRN